MSQNIEKLIKERIKSYGDWRGKAIEELIAAVRSADNTLEEDWKWDTLVWNNSGLICAVGGFKDKVSLNFFKGASIKDPEKVFNDGLEAKTSRRVSYFEGDKINTKAIKDLVKQAIELNKK